MAEALAVQREVARQLGVGMGGWKAGVPLKGDPTRAPLFANLIYQSGARIPAADHPMLIIEAEMGFRIARDLEGDREYTRERIAAAVDAAFCAIEIADSRLENFYTADLFDRVADNMGNGAVVVGSECRDWHGLERSGLRVTLDIGGKRIADKLGGNPSGDPLSPLVWLANELADQGGLKAGQIVITGSWTGMAPARRGDEVVARLESLGEARVTFV